MTVSLGALVVCSLLITACTSTDEEQKSRLNSVVIKHESGKIFISKYKDKVLDVPQNLKLFKNQIYSQDIRSRQRELNKKFDELFFSPWKGSVRTKIVPSGFGGSFFGENLHRLSSKDTGYIRTNIKYRTSLAKKGIIVKNTMARVWPTNSQLFSNLRNPGDSYPFDSNIQSLIRLGTPVRILAISNDGLWAFVSSYAFAGWVSRHDVAYVDKRFIKRYMAYEKTVAIRDGIVISYKGSFLNRADIGTILPRDKRGVLCPYKDFSGSAKLVHCNVSGFVRKPLEFTPENAIKITEQFLGQKYGWGGYLNHRDCSMLTMDYCTTFGILMPRNGRAQLSQGNHEFLQKDKINFILKKGVPFLTLVGWKGHVMLYIGKYQNKPVFLHNIWGSPRRPRQKSRFVIGKTVITTSDLGGNIKQLNNCTLEDVITMIRFI